MTDQSLWLLEVSNSLSLGFKVGWSLYYGLLCKKSQGVSVRERGPIQLRHASDTQPTHDRHASDTPPTHDRHASDTPPTRLRHTTDARPMRIRRITDACPGGVIRNISGTGQKSCGTGFEMAVAIRCYPLIRRVEESDQQSRPNRQCCGLLISGALCLQRDPKLFFPSPRPRPLNPSPTPPAN